MTERAGRDLTRRTWELELLVSGAVVIGLFQLPGIVDSAYLRIAPHLSADLHMIPFLAYYLAKAAIYALTGAFMIHLLLRGYWVGLIGLGSAFPEGIHWDRLKLGPVLREIQQQEIVGIDRIEPKIDRVASTLFSVLFSLLSMLAGIALYTVASIALAAVLIRLGIVDLSFSIVFSIIYYLLLGVTVLPLVVLRRLDQRMAQRGRTPTGRWFPLLLRVAFRVFKYGFLAFLWVPIQYVLTSNLTGEGRKAGWRQSAPFTIVVLLPFLMFFTAELGPRVLSRLHSYIYFPTGQHSRVHDPDLYESTRDSSTQPKRPVLESEIAAGPYLRLFLPYRPKHDNPVLAELCPGLPPFYADGTLAPTATPDDGEAGATKALACFHKLYSVELDGQLLAPDYLFSQHRQTATRGLLTRISVADLAPGRHEIVVTKVRQVTGSDNESNEVERTWLPFWR